MPRDAGVTPFRRIRERILAAGRNPKAGDGAIAVVVTAGKRGEGVTTVALGLARAFAHAPTHRTLLIDHDSAEGGVAARLELTPRTVEAPPTAGGGSSMRGAVQAVEAFGFDLLTLGPGHGRALTDEGVWDMALGEIRSAYDVVIVDAGSLERHVPIGWSRWADQTILVVDTTSTTRPALARLQADLRYWGQPVTGVVLNKRRLPVPAALYRRFR